MTIGVPSASRAQVCEASSTEGSARICRDTETSPGIDNPPNGRVVGKRRQMLRRRPGERAAEITPAAAQFHRNQIVGAARHAFAGEADEQPAVLHELRHALVIGAGDLADVGKHEHRDAARKNVGDRAFAEVGVRRQGAFR